ncbi:GntG family PLP-dependent aldolase [Micromonospora profundi]|uniref:threonine aldolase family protein n=1 Tax=Micromonospora profundi TaxID=1420889 RepID=UPI0033BD8B35
MLDLRSDTLTMPTQEMLRAMWASPVGDDGYGEDPTTNALEEYCADLFGKEEAVFMPSGTMSNQIALRLHTRPGDEIVVEESYHLNTYESAPSADLAGVVVNPVRATDGLLTPDLILAAVDGKCRDPRYAQVRMIGVENTINYRSGRVVPLASLHPIREFAQANGMAVHLDGARLFNAVVATGTTAKEYATTADTVSTCFAKGLGAPFGSVLVGPADLMREARYYRKSYGGALHQCGHLAGAALYALRHNVERLAEDHVTARALAEALLGEPLLGVAIDEVQSNIVIVDVSNSGLTAQRLTELAHDEGLLMVPISRYRVRFVTRMGISMSDVLTAAKIFCDLVDQHALPLR